MFKVVEEDFHGRMIHSNDPRVCRHLVPHYMQCILQSSTEQELAYS